MVRTGAFIEAPEVERSQQAFAEAHGLAAAAGVGSGTDALALVLRALGIGPGDEVLAPSMTFICTPRQSSTPRHSRGRRRTPTRCC